LWSSTLPTTEPGPFPRIDSHVHVFPDRLAAAVREALNRGGVLGDGYLLPEVAREVAAQGFDAAWALPYAHRAGVAESVNEWAAAEVSRHGSLIAGATFHPDDAAFEGLVERALVELRLRVVKLHCSVGNFSPEDPRLEPLWRTAERLAVPVVVHAGRSQGDSSPEDLEAVVPVLRAHPGLPFVLAHAGHPAESRTLALMAEHANLYADLTPVWDSSVEIPAEAFARFAGRFLFGSDAPNNPLPAAKQAARLERLGLDGDALALALGGAAAGLVPWHPAGDEKRHG
jgi:predicted TIM-barrel fold metal-dependent hydrolase